MEKPEYLWCNLRKILIRFRKIISLLYLLWWLMLYIFSFFSWQFLLFYSHFRLLIPVKRLMVLTIQFSLFFPHHLQPFAVFSIKSSLRVVQTVKTKIQLYNWLVQLESIIGNLSDFVFCLKIELSNYCFQHQISSE